MKNKSTRLMGHIVLIVGVALSSLSGLALIGGSAQAVVSTDSAQTIAWTDQHPSSTSQNAADFANLQFTISQTSNLGHQGIDITWSGGHQTTSTAPGRYDTNFMQIMQCWGDSGEPSPDQCQFGAAPTNVLDTVGASSVTASRSLSDYDPAFIRAQHPDLRLPSDHSVFMYPFTSVKGEKTFDYGTLFTANTSNEVPAARTGSDGTGRVTFEVQTSLEANHLGCGGDVAQPDGSTISRSCWLVIVPRGSLNPDGSSPNFPPGLQGSPFSPTNWADRIVVPLGFESVSQNCPLGQAERRLVGNEIVADAFTSWQPGLCQSGTTYGFSMIGDSEARSQMMSAVSGAARMAFVSSPLSDTERKGVNILYAPVVRSALVFAFTADYSVLSTANPDTYAKNGTRLDHLVLNQRLVAKMLTQSYQADNPCGGTGDSVLESNPQSITTDPEFIALNPDFAFWNANYPQGMMVELGSSDAIRTVWEWIRSSPDAVAFLKGVPDDHGMRLNPEYMALKLGEGKVIDSFPKTDLSTCRETNYAEDQGYGSLDMRPYYGDMQETAYRTLRADGNVKNIFDPFKTPAGYKAAPPQTAGQRIVLSLTDASAAARYGLDIATITNVNGDQVLPTVESISAGVSAFKPSSVSGVLVANPASANAGVYPLSQMVYAAINTCQIDAPMAADYARVLVYAATDGQASGSARGMLPLGYVPMSDAEKAQALSTASALADPDGLRANCRTTSTTSGTTSTTYSGGSGGSAPVPSASASPSASAAASLGITKDHIGVDTALAGIGLAAGIPMCIAGPMLLRRSQQRRR